jgi:hypothetical protein
MDESSIASSPKIPIQVRVLKVGLVPPPHPVHLEGGTCLVRPIERASPPDKRIRFTVRLIFLGKLGTSDPSARGRSKIFPEDWT